MFVPLTPIRCLHRAVDLFGSKIGVVSGEQQFTYAQFGDRCERLATALPKFGVAPGDRVAYLSFNNHQLMEGYYGVVQARAIVMPLNVRLSEQELTVILNHSGAKMLMFENDFAPLVEKLAEWAPIPTTYAGGASSLTDLELVTELGRGKIDLTIGSALDIFGGTGVRYEEVVTFNRGLNVPET